MKTLILIAAASATILSCANAGAAVVANPGANVLSVQEIRAKTLQSFEFSRAAYREFHGEYLLDDGRSVRLSRDGRRFFVEVSGQPKIEVRASSADTFVAIAGGTELVFKQHANGIVSRVLLKQPVNG